MAHSTTKWEQLGTKRTIAHLERHTFPPHHSCGFEPCFCNSPNVTVKDLQFLLPPFRTGQLRYTVMLICLRGYGGLLSPFSRSATALSMWSWCNLPLQRIIKTTQGFCSFMGLRILHYSLLKDRIQCHFLCDV